MPSPEGHPDGDSPSPGAQAPRPTRGAELKRVLEAERRGVAFLLLREGDGPLAIHELTSDSDALTVGRDTACDIAIPWDAGVSRLHAEITVRAGSVALGDDGLSRNGTWVNGARVSGRRRLEDGDLVRVGGTLLLFRAPRGPGPSATTVVGQSAVVTITTAQRRVLIELCRPMAVDLRSPPASNQQIADALFLSIPAVKTHIRSLFSALGVEDLPQSRKRARLAQLAFRLGVVSEREIGTAPSGESAAGRHEPPAPS
ncbi:MAG TPA: FHA domain-containing protein [Solirubrobacteraceae bacterium]|nr:FHA domain-containing protein [Solirubrobacteraceae bacterium]